MRELVFREITKEDRKLFENFELKSKFADTTFTLLYAWKDRFRYELATYNDIVIVRESTRDGRHEYIIIGCTEKRELCAVIFKLCKHVETIQEKLILKYISKEQIEVYESVLERIGKEYSIDWADIYSDYIYETEQFINLSGTVNRQKRENNNWLSRNFPNIRYERYTEEKHADCVKIFNSWCEWHSCDKCYYGCEREAFFRVLDIYDPQKHIIGMAYIDDNPISFAVAEQINVNTVSYLFQKNAKRLRGLMYWLNREMAKEHAHIKYINLGEDMGIEGIRKDKSGLHPCDILEKYTITIG